MKGISWKTIAGLLILAILLGRALPCLLALSGNSGSRDIFVLRCAAWAVLIFIAQFVPFRVSLAGGLIVTASMLIARLLLYRDLPPRLIAFEILCLLGIPLLLTGLTRLWLRAAIGRRAAFVFTAMNLLSVLLLLRIGRALLMDGPGSGPALPDLFGIFLGFLVECGVYAALYLSLYADGEGWTPAG